MKDCEPIIGLDIKILMYLMDCGAAFFNV